MLRASKLSVPVMVLATSARLFAESAGLDFAAESFPRNSTPPVESKAKYPSNPKVKVVANPKVEKDTFVTQVRRFIDGLSKEKKDVVVALVRIEASSVALGQSVPVKVIATTGISSDGKGAIKVDDLKEHSAIRTILQSNTPVIAQAVIAENPVDRKPTPASAASLADSALHGTYMLVVIGAKNENGVVEYTDGEGRPVRIGFYPEELEQFKINRIENLLNTYFINQSSIKDIAEVGEKKDGNAVFNALAALAGKIPAQQ